MMNSIERYLESISSFNDEKKPFMNKLEGIDEQIDSIESQIEELESELSDLEQEKEAPLGEIKRIEKKQLEAYLLSLSDPKEAIIKRVEEGKTNGLLSSLSLVYPDSEPTIIVQTLFKRITVSVTFPESANSFEQYGPLCLNVEPKESTQPWQVKKTLKLMKQHGFLNSLKRIGECSYLLPSALENQPEVVLQRLLILAGISEELDAPMSYEFNPKETV